MALKFNPFEKDKAAVVPQVKRSHYRVFDDPTRVADAANHEVKKVELDSIIKQATNGSQIDHKWITKQTTNGSQTDHSKKTQKQKRITQQTTNGSQKGSQIDHKRITITDFSTLVGHERKLLLFIFNECRISGELTTSPITLSTIKENLKMQSSNAAKTVLGRIISKGFLRRETSKKGRGGWMSFKIEQEVFQRLLLETDYKRITNGSQMDHKQITKQITQQITSAPSSSSKILDLNKTTTTENAEDHVNFSQTLPTDPSWDKIDHDSLKEIGFNASHVAQIQQQGLHSPKTLQDSIYAFYYDLNANSKAKEISGPALNYFMGILRRGPYSPPANYESPEDQQLREYLEAKEKLLEGRRAKLERLKALEFEEWADSLSREQVEKLAPMGSSDTLKRSQLRNHFDEKVWEEKKIKIVSELGAESDSHILRNPENTSYDRGTIPPLHPPSTRV